MTPRGITVQASVGRELVVRGEPSGDEAVGRTLAEAVRPIAEPRR